MNSHDTLNSKKCCLSRNAAVFLVYDRDSGRARWLAIGAAVLTVSASSHAAWRPPHDLQTPQDSAMTVT